MIPGEYDLKKGSIELNKGKDVTKLAVSNTADRPIQVGSHYHFYETNSKLKFNRKEAYGKRLNIPAGTSVRFEPGQTRVVELVAYGGLKTVAGFRGLVKGDLKSKRPRWPEAEAKPGEEPKPEEGKDPSDGGK
jgi:urease beta subunit